MPNKGHPPEPVDFGAMTDNCGNCIVWMRPELLDEIGIELANGGIQSGIAMLAVIKVTFDRDAAQIRAAQNDQAHSC